MSDLQSLQIFTPTVSRDVACKHLNEWLAVDASGLVSEEDLVYSSWPQTFSSTAGPFKGIGGQAFWAFRMEAWVFEERLAVVFCKGEVVKVGHFSIHAKW